MGMQIADVASGSYNSIIGILAAAMYNTKDVLTELGYKDSEIEEFEKTGLFS